MCSSLLHFQSWIEVAKLFFIVEKIGRRKQLKRGELGNGDIETTFENEDHDLYICNMLHVMNGVEKLF